MGKITASAVSLYVEDASGASQSISGLGNSITLSWSSDAPEVTAFGNTTRERLPNGLKDWELSFDGFYDPESDSIDDILSGILGGATVIQLGPAGSSASDPKFTASGILTSYEIGIALEDALTVSATFTARSGSMTRGTWS